MARRGRKSSLHSASKSVEADLVASARLLADDPGPVTPQCIGPCPLFCPARKARQRIAQVHAVRDDEAKLQKLANSDRNPLARAYAATLLIGHAGKVPVVAELRLPTGNVPYVIRGKALPFPLAGVQHSDDPALRLFAVAPFVKKRGFHFYALGDGLVCTHKRPAPPAEFVTQELTALGFDETEPGRWVCERAGAAAGEDTLVIDWHTAGARIELAATSARADQNTVRKLIEHIASPRARDEFRVRVEYAPLEPAAGGEPVALEAAEVPGTTEYLAGKTPDRAFLEAARENRTHVIETRGDPRYVIGNTSHGNDEAAFIDALGPTPVERRALIAALQGNERPVILERGSAARALAQVWTERGRAALVAAAAGSEAVADQFYREDAGVDAIPELLQKAASRGGEARVRDELPAYRRLPGPAAVADAVARAHRAKGTEEAVRLALQKAREGRDRGVALACLQALGQSEGQDWRFKGTEQELAEALRPLAEALLSSDADQYHATLEALSRRAGSLEPLERSQPPK